MPSDQSAAERLLVAHDVGRPTAGFEPMRRFDGLCLLGGTTASHRRSPLSEV